MATRTFSFNPSRLLERPDLPKALRIVAIYLADGPTILMNDTLSDLVISKGSVDHSDRHTSTTTLPHAVEYHNSPVSRRPDAGHVHRVLSGSNQR